jgi:hypothetical protein
MRWEDGTEANKRWEGEGRTEEVGIWDSRGEKREKGWEEVNWVR